MGTLYIDRKDIYVKLDGNALTFYINGEREGQTPIMPLKRVIVIGGSIKFDANVLHRLADENISVLFLSGKQMRFCGMMHGRLHNNGLLRVMQYQKSITSMQLDLAKTIVLRKIEAQKTLLIRANERRDDLRYELIHAIKTLNSSVEDINSNCSIDSIRGVEGGVAAVYFSAYTKLFPPSLNFTKRTRRPPLDPVNAVLSLCYTLLHYEMVREIEVIGLDPTIGFYHKFDYGRESLACDLVEPYRPEVDKFVWQIFREREFASRDFSTDDERPGCYMKKESRKRFYPLWEEWLKDMRPRFTEEVRTLARRILDGQDLISE